MNTILNFFSLLEFLGVTLLVIGVMALTVVMASLTADVILKLLKDKEIKLKSLGIHIVIGELSVLACYSSLKLRDSLYQTVYLKEEYSLSITGMNTMTLFKKDIRKEMGLEITELNGIKIEKEVPKEKEYNKEILRVNCGSLSYNECVGKVKDNLEVLTADMGNNSSVSSVVKF